MQLTHDAFREHQAERRTVPVLICMRRHHVAACTTCKDSHQCHPLTPRDPPGPEAMLDDAGKFFLPPCPLSTHSLSGSLGATGRAVLKLLSCSWVRIILLWSRHTDGLE